MKFFLLTFITLIISSNSFAAKAVELARELHSIKVEYISSSDRGLIYVYGCSQCKGKTYYEFNSKPIIKKEGKTISFDDFLTDYRNGKFFTLFLSLDNHSVQRINY